MQQNCYHVSYYRQKYLLPANANMSNIAESDPKADSKGRVTQPAQDDATNQQDPEELLRVLSEDRLVSLDIECVVKRAAMDGDRVMWATLCND